MSSTFAPREQQCFLPPFGERPLNSSSWPLTMESSSRRVANSSSMDSLRTFRQLKVVDVGILCACGVSSVPFLTSWNPSCGARESAFESDWDPACETGATIGEANLETSYEAGVSRRGRFGSVLWRRNVVLLRRCLSGGSLYLRRWSNSQIYSNKFLKLGNFLS